MRETINEMFSLKGKVAIVTGGNRGIGKGIARGLAGAGADIVIGDIIIGASDEANISDAVAEIKADFDVKVLGLKVDVRQALEAFGRIDILSSLPEPPYFSQAELRISSRAQPCL